MAYHRYRGQKSLIRRFRNIMLAVIVIAAVFVAAFLYLRRYMVYTDEGAYLDIPFLRSAEQPVQTPEITLELVAPMPEVTPVSNTPTPILPELDILRAAFVPAGDAADILKADEYIRLCKETGINALIIEMKSENGMLGYKSSVEAAVTAGAPGSDTRAFISKLKAEDIYLGAYISCFKDNLVPRKLPAMSVKVQSGVIWLDAHMEGWLNPYIEESRQYIIDICEELCALGFDEIVLDNAVFPTAGRPALINYAENASIPKTSCINGFIEELSKAVSAHETLLSAVVLRKTAEEGLYADAGQDFAELADMLDRVFVPISSSGTENEFETVYESAMSIFKDQDDAKKRLVPIITAARTGAASPSEALSVTLGMAGGSRGFGYMVKGGQTGYSDIQEAFVTETD